MAGVQPFLRVPLKGLFLWVSPTFARLCSAPRSATATAIAAPPPFQCRFIRGGPSAVAPPRVQSLLNHLSKTIRAPFEALFDFSQVDLNLPVQQLLIPNSPKPRARRLNPRFAPVKSLLSARRPAFSRFTGRAQAANRGLASDWLRLSRPRCSAAL